MVTRLLLLISNAVLVNVAFLLSFLVRYGWPFPQRNFLAYKRGSIYVTLIYVLALAFVRVYKSRFKSSWELFRRVVLGLFYGTLLSVAFVYVFRIKWQAFPTSVFVLSFFISLLLVFKTNQFVLRAGKRIGKNIVVIGRGDYTGIVGKKASVQRIGTDQIGQILKRTDIDEVVICERIPDEEGLNLLFHLIHKLKIDVVFSPSLYVKLLSGRINGDDSISYLSTFAGEKRDVEEFLMRSLDILGSILILLVFAPVIITIALLVKVSSAGPVLYRQERVGKDGRVFTLYKFRTMVKGAEEKVGPVLASRTDPRATKVGRILRATRLDELPQLLNVLGGDMSLVGPRPERPHFVRKHKALHELRLAVKPGLTGLAQIRSLYDLKPRHKIKYDYLYIQKRSLPFNLYILARTIPVILSRRGW